MSAVDSFDVSTYPHVAKQSFSDDQVSKPPEKLVPGAGSRSFRKRAPEQADRGRNCIIPACSKPALQFPRSAAEALSIVLRVHALEAAHQATPP